MKNSSESEEETGNKMNPEKEEDPEISKEQETMKVFLEVNKNEICPMAADLIQICQEEALKYRESISISTLKSSDISESIDFSSSETEELLKFYKNRTGSDWFIKEINKEVIKMLKKDDFLGFLNDYNKIKFLAEYADKLGVKVETLIYMYFANKIVGENEENVEGGKKFDEVINTYIAQIHLTKLLKGKINDIVLNKIPKLKEEIRLLTEKNNTF